ncbi:uncharacterized protein LOC124594644 [Schistocerca americana]|uniref:uncharacterized protein LOC124594644 n=1 Tax=Schistocerca americana TaxID=7009 RepID=UPI001F4F3813|nr:uncharacterized protein LOC124594644 [Schistocerca americana]
MEVDDGGDGHGVQVPPMGPCLPPENADHSWIDVEAMAKWPSREVRNRRVLPDMGTEGVWVPAPPRRVHPDSLPTIPEAVGARLTAHQTLSSVRQMRRFRQIGVPRDSLDLALSANYDHARELFPEKCDVLLQPETLGVATWRKDRNVRLELVPQPPFRGHPLNHGGVPQRPNPHSKRGGSFNPHHPKSKDGYTRTPFGSFYAH